MGRRKESRLFQIRICLLSFLRMGGEYEERSPQNVCCRAGHKTLGLDLEEEERASLPDSLVEAACGLAGKHAGISGWYKSDKGAGV